jgi:hypothetical protein
MDVIFNFKISIIAYLYKIYENGEPLLRLTEKV